MLVYKFAFDTGSRTPLFCKKPAYGPHKKKIIMTQIDNLLQNNWICNCKGVWGSKIVLEAKPHQEDVNKTDEFI